MKLKTTLSILATLGLTSFAAAQVTVDAAFFSVAATGSGVLPATDFGPLNTATGFPTIQTGDLAESGTFTASQGFVLGNAGNLNTGSATQAAIFSNEALNNTTVKTFFLDLGAVFEVAEILTFAHNRSPSDINTSRANQHFTLFAATGNEVGFVAGDIATYTSILTVNTLTGAGIDNDLGGVGGGLSNNDYGYTGIRIYDAGGKLGDFRYLAFATNPVAQTGNALYSGFYEIDVIAVPEPSTYAALLGLMALAWVAVRRRKV
ncbi:MAG: PEP-CTERM sorting domain-containing protein [Verrucomicrobia bacterium]|nr:PEP-CTERM sorting domain-containing protein [Verrucomicrobiota bacterium]